MMFEDLRVWLANAFLPLFQWPEDQDAQWLRDFDAATPMSGTQWLTLGIIAAVLLRVRRLEKGSLAFFTHFFVLLPFIGFGLGFLQFGEAMFVFVLELVVYFLVFVLHLSFGVLTAGPGKILAHFTGKKPKQDRPTRKSASLYAYFGGPKPITGALAHPVIACLTLFTFAFMSYAAIASALQVSGTGEYQNRFGKQIRAADGPESYQAIHDQMMRLKAHCLRQPLPTRRELNDEAEFTFSQCQVDDPAVALNQRWEQDFLYGSCTATQRSKAPWFMGLCLLGLLLMAWRESVFTNEDAPSGSIPVYVVLLSFRLLLLSLIPALIVDFLEAPQHMSILTVTVLGIQRLLTASFLSEDDDESDQEETTEGEGTPPDDGT